MRRAQIVVVVMLNSDSLLDDIIAGFAAKCFAVSVVPKREMFHLRNRRLSQASHRQQVLCSFAMAVFEMNRCELN